MKKFNYGFKYDQNNPKHTWNWRKQKKEMKRLSAAILRSGYFEDCFGNPCKLTEITPPQFIQGQRRFNGYCEGDPLQGGSGGNCSLWHCWPWPLEKV